jgi:hypothetical protein
MVSSIYAVRKHSVTAICLGNPLESPLWAKGPNAMFNLCDRNLGIRQERVRLIFIDDQVPMKHVCAHPYMWDEVIQITSDQSSHMTRQVINFTGVEERL